MAKIIDGIKSQRLIVEVNDDGTLTVSYQYLMKAGGEALYSKGRDVTPFLTAVQLAWLQSKLDALASLIRSQEGI